MISYMDSLSCPPCATHSVTMMFEISFCLEFSISVQYWTSVGNHLNTARVVFLAHIHPISIYAAWLRIRTDISSTIPVSILLDLKGWDIGLELKDQNGESFIIFIWSVVGSWFCLDELGSKRAPIPCFSIFPLAVTLQHALLCVVRSIHRICVQGLIAEIPECWDVRKTANHILNITNVFTLNIKQSKMYGYLKHILKSLFL